MNIKFALVNFSYYDRTGMERYLEKMALKGWQLEKIYTGCWKFRKIEPQKLHYTVIYSPRGSQFKDGPTQEQIIFREMCGEAGWKQAVCREDMIIFYSEEEDPTPIETEPMVQVESIHLAMEKGFLKDTKRILICMFLYVALILYVLYLKPFDFLTSSRMIYGCFVIFLGIIIYYGDMRGYQRWHRRAEEAAEKGIFLPTKGNNYFSIYVLLALIISTLWYGFTLPSWKTGVLVFGRFAIWFFVLLVLRMIDHKVRTGDGDEKTKRIKAYVIVCIVAFGCIQLLNGIENEFVEAGFLNETNHTVVDTVTVDGFTYEIRKDELTLTLEDLMDGNFEPTKEQIRIAAEKLRQC